MQEHFIEYKGKLYNLKDLDIVYKENEFLVLKFQDITISISGSNITLPLKYNVVREFLASSMVYNKHTNVLTYDDINRPDECSTDGVYNGEKIINAITISVTKIAILFDNNKTRIIYIKKLPIYKQIQNSGITKVKFTKDKIYWNEDLYITVQDLMTCPVVFDKVKPKQFIKQIEKNKQKIITKVIPSEGELQITTQTKLQEEEI